MQAWTCWVTKKKGRCPSSSPAQLGSSAWRCSVQGSGGTGEGSGRGPGGGKGPAVWGVLTVCGLGSLMAPHRSRPQNCMFDTCNCEKSEVCLCAALSSYVWACAARGVLLSGWRDGVCSEYAGSLRPTSPGVGAPWAPIPCSGLRGQRGGNWWGPGSQEGL